MLITEKRNELSANLDEMSVQELVHVINNEQQIPAAAVKKVATHIAQAVILIEKGLKNGGRLFYVGAGTSGRLGVLDASECPPTFCTPPSMVQGIIAGGEKALTTAVEAAEDNREAGFTALKNCNLTKNDVVVGISCSGRASYVTGALEAAREASAATIMHSCVENDTARKLADVAIITIVGPEVLTGSTRMKGGTATKMVLNILSTAAMVRLGKVYDNLMVDVKPSNQKLRERAAKMVVTLTGLSLNDSSDLLDKSHWKVKTAVVMHFCSIPCEEAETLLEKEKGKLRAVISKYKV